MAQARLPRVNSAVAALLRIAGDLRGLPRPSFKARLAADLSKNVAAVRRRTVATPYLMIRDAARAINFYKEAFGAEELMRMADSSGHIAHAEIKIGSAPIMIADEDPGNFNLSPDSLGGSSAFIHLYVDNIDAFAERAERGGAKILEPPSDRPYGDRGAKFADPFGHVWMVATHMYDVAPQQLKADWDRAVKAELAAAAKPEGYYSITPYLQVNGAARFIDFLKAAFGADEVMRVNDRDGSILHAQMKIEGSAVELADANEQFKPNLTAIWLFVGDVDGVYERALKAGATPIHPPMDQDYGNREGSVRDPFGNHWYIATPLPSAAPWPRELRSVTPYLHPKGASKLIDFLKEAFDAEEVARHADERGAVLHAQIRIGDSIIAMGEAHVPYQPMPPALHLYVPDVDSTYRSALRAGAKSMYAPRDESYGDRSSGVTDPFGNVWYIATHKRVEIPRMPNQRQSALESEPATEASAAIMPFMYFESAETAADFYKKVFRARELHREVEADGHVSHVQIAIGNTNVMLCGATAAHFEEGVAKGHVRTPHQLGGTPLHLYVHVPDVDDAFQRAIDGGSRMVNPIKDEDWGDRCCGVQDPFGHIWYIATPLGQVRR